MTLTETNIYWIFTSQGREFHYPKAVWSEQSAREHLENYFAEVGKFESKRKK